MAVLFTSIACGACGPRFDLSEVPVSGGSPEQRQAVRDELNRFSEWTGLGRIRLTEVEIVPTDSSQGDWWAGYRRGSARVRVASSLSLFEMEVALRHELCHALDHQEQMLDEPIPLFEHVVEMAESDVTHPLHPAMEGSNRRKRSEVMAYVCEQGPLGTAFLVHPCADVEAGYEAVADWTHGHVWSGEPDVTSAAGRAADESDARWAGAFELKTLQMVGAPDANQVSILAAGEEVGSIAGTHVSLEDGMPVEEFAADLAPIYAGYEVAGPHGAPPRSDFDPALYDGIQAVSDGLSVLALVAGAGMTHLGPQFAPHVIVHTDGRWSTVAGACPTDVASVFLANGGLYVGWAEGSEVFWAVVD